MREKSEQIDLRERCVEILYPINRIPEPRDIRIREPVVNLIADLSQVYDNFPGGEQLHQHESIRAWTAGYYQRHQDRNIGMSQEENRE